MIILAWTIAKTVFFSFKISSMMIEWITLTQKQSQCGLFIIHFVYNF